jgi:hypothetical protein
MVVHGVRRHRGVPQKRVVAHHSVIGAERPRETRPIAVLGFRGSVLMGDTLPEAATLSEIRIHRTYPELNRNATIRLSDIAPPGARFAGVSRTNRRASVRQAHEWGFRQLVAYRLRTHRGRHVSAALGRLLTQVDIATRLGRPQSYVSNLEIGNRRVDVSEVRLVAAAYEIAVDALLAEPTNEQERKAYRGEIAPPTRPRN